MCSVLYVYDRCVEFSLLKTLTMIQVKDNGKAADAPRNIIRAIVGSLDLLATQEIVFADKQIENVTRNSARDAKQRGL